MSDAKTRPTETDPRDFIAEVGDPKKIEQSHVLLELMEEITGEPPVMWGGSIIGFGIYTYTYATGRTGDWPLVGFSPRKQKFSLYIMSGFDKNPELMQQLGKYKTGKSCLYVNKLEDIDLEVLRKLIKASIQFLREKYPS